MFHQHDGRLFADEVSVDALADRFGSPLYIYSASSLRGSYETLARTLPRDAEIMFSIKANSNPHIAAVFRALGGGAEVASSGEINIARRAGFDPSRTVFAGPGKSDRELAEWLKFGGGVLNLESVAEARRLDRLAGTGRVRVCLRINPTSPGVTPGMAMGGKSLPFGVDQD